MITGPAFIPNIENNQKVMTYQIIGNELAVPTHCFKVFLLLDENENMLSIECWLLPNSPVIDADIYRLGIDELETKIHLKFPEVYHQ